MNPIYQLLGIQNNIEVFNKNIIKIGWLQANKQFIAGLGITQKTSLLNFPEKGAVLIYSNHITGLDPYLLSSALNRDDVYIISDIYQTRKGENIKEHIIPVYYSSLLEAFKRPGLAFFGFIIMRLLSGIFNASFTRDNNLKVIDKAVDHLKKGNVVIIFPSGGELASRQWRKGIGEIILACSEKKINFNLYKCFFPRLKEFDLLKHFLTGKSYFKKFPIMLEGNIISLNKLKSLSDPIKITACLQDAF